MAKGFVGDIDKLTISNMNFRSVLYTSKYAQLVVMNILPNEEIGEEIHSENDQFFRVEEGSAKVIIDGNEYLVSSGFAIVVPAGAKHNIINTSNQNSLKLYTLYSPPHHLDKTVHVKKSDAVDDPEHFEGVTTE